MTGLAFIVTFNFWFRVSESSNIHEGFAIKTDECSILNNSQYSIGINSL